MWNVRFSVATRPLACFVEVAAQTVETALVLLDTSEGVRLLVVEQRGSGAEILKGSLFIGERKGFFFFNGQSMAKEF